MNHQTPDPTQALDFPDLPDDTWVIWSGNQIKWPDGRRTMNYLTAKRRSYAGFALWTPWYEDAITFESEEDARKWLEAENRPYQQETIISIGELKKLKGYVT